eukprot:symbB.v1.2.013522.t1/scaffold795.1/size259473/14
MTARVDRFTHYLLHGPPGARDSKPPEPRVAVRNTHAEALLALSLRAMTPKVDKELSWHKFTEDPKEELGSLETMAMMAWSSPNPGEHAPNVLTGCLIYL